MPCTNYWGDEEKKQMAKLHKDYETNKSKSTPKTGLSEIKEIHEEFTMPLVQIKKQQPEFQIKSNSKNYSHNYKTQVSTKRENENIEAILPESE